MRLIPTDTRFFALLSDAAGNLVTGAQLLGELIAAAPADRSAITARMRQTEHSGDEITHDIMNRLNTSFVTPFDREDISNLAGRLDDVLDAMDEAADLAVLYRIGSFPAGVADQVDCLTRAAAATADAMPKLANLHDLDQYWITVNDLENEADDVYRTLRANLFNNGTDAIAVMKIKEVIDQLESAADCFEHAANIVQTIAAKES
jgi:predicted phosphate transport protein (TIGR00153 family)